MQTSFHKSVVDRDETPWYMLPFVMGYDEGEGGEAEGVEGEEGGEGEGGEGEPDESALPDPIKAILKKERDLRAAADKKVRILEKNAAAAKKAGDGKAAGKSGEEKGAEGGAEGDKVDKSTAAKMEKLIVGFRNTSLQGVVAGLAQQFQDPSDVYSFLDTSAFDYTQDEEDPTNVVWDEAEIRTAIKALAKQKPYLLKPAGDQGASKKGTSGPKFAGSGSGKQTGGITNAEMLRRYPAMRTAIRAGNQKSE